MPDQDRKFDVRTIDGFLRRGRVTHEEYEEHLESLPDVSEKAEKMESEFVEGVLDSDEDSEDE